MPEPKLVSSAIAARELGVHRGTLSRWVTEGKVTAAEETAGGHYRWDVADLRRQLQVDEEATALDPLRAAFEHARVTIASMDDPHAALVVVARLVPTLQAMVVAVQALRTEVVQRIYDADALALKPLADRVSTSHARRRGRS